MEGKETLSASEEDFGAIIISEIMYDPKSSEPSSIGDGGDGDDERTRTGQKAARSGEWCEFLNPSSTDSVDMSSWYFTDEKNLNSENMFQFPLNTTVKPKERIVVAKNATKFELAHRGEPNEEKVAVVVVKDAKLPFKLSNKGEKLILLNAEKELVHEVEYNDKPPWPIIFPGYSIELTSAKSDANDPFSWVSSLVLGGTPGRENSVELVNALNN